MNGDREEKGGGRVVSVSDNEGGGSEERVGGTGEMKLGVQMSHTQRYKH